MSQDPWPERSAAEGRAAYQQEQSMAEGGVAAGRLKSFVERLERLEDEKRDIAEQLKDVMAEAKGEGFDVKTLRQVLKLRKMKPHDRTEQEELLEIYMAALGMA
jgi:uncharacterized protein (UPF0335 family)